MGLNVIKMYFAQIAIVDKAISMWAEIQFWQQEICLLFSAASKNVLNAPWQVFCKDL